MYPQSKLTLQRINSLKLALILIVGISVIGIILSLLTYSCGLNHVLLTTDIQTNEKFFDPESCAKLVDRIISFNDNCDQEFEILDCS